MQPREYCSIPSYSNFNNQAMLSRTHRFDELPTIRVNFWSLRSIIFFIMIVVQIQTKNIYDTNYETEEVPDKNFTTQLCMLLRTGTSKIPHNWRPRVDVPQSNNEAGENTYANKIAVMAGSR
jgi:hypothetical protein